MATISPSTLVAKKKVAAPKAAKPAKSQAVNSLPRHTIVALTWLDAAFDLDKSEDIIPLTTIGYLIHQDATKITVAGEGNVATGFFRAFTTVPAGMVQDLQALVPAPAAPEYY